MAAASLAATSLQPRWASEKCPDDPIPWVVGGDPRAPGGEGPRWFVTVSPGSVKVSSSDLARGQRTAERLQRAHEREVDLLARELAEGVEGSEGSPERVIVGWSRKSRANMVRRLVTLDYAPMVEGGQACMVTLTYPGEWLVVAPDGAAVKRHLAAFRKRYTRSFGRMKAVWKMEFQRRGAPHFHLFTVCPDGVDLREFRLWVAETWSAVIAHPDPEQRVLGLNAGTNVDTYEGGRMTDPRRVSVYFTKHGLFGAKEYQNHPPAEWADTGSVGRFWGYWTLRPVEVAVEVAPAEALLITRTLRRWQRQHRYLRAVQVERVEQSTGRIRVRAVRRPVRKMPGSAGFLSVNSGPSVALMLDQLLAKTPRRLTDRGVVTTR